MKWTRKLRPALLLRTLRKRKYQRFIKRYGVVLVVLFIVAIATIFQAMQVRIERSAYTPLLSVIASGESHGNYNAYFRHGGNTTIRFTDMTIAQVMQWQKDYVAQGSPSSAVGKYQIIRPTMQKLVDKLGIDPQAKFDEQMQDRMAISLLEKRGSISFVKNDLSREEFAANLAKEWASLPRITGDNPSASYYAGDGLNASHVSIDQIYRAIDKLKS